jgi:hypothetical protein
MYDTVAIFEQIGLVETKVEMEKVEGLQGGKEPMSA